MKTSEKYYEGFRGDRVVPENPFQEAVVRQAILADKWDLSEAERALLPKSDQFEIGLLAHGGQAIYHRIWNPHCVVHYQLGNHLDDGFFDLTLRLVSAVDSSVLGSICLLAALTTRPQPAFQVPWRGPPRVIHLIPNWYYVPARAHPVGLKTRVNSALHGALLLPGDTRPVAEWHCSPPHVQLLDVDSIGN